MSECLAIVTARGGSVELRRKNLLPIDGEPMFLRSAQAARDAGCRVIVSTDDPEIRSTAVVAGFEVHDRGPELAEVVVDDVVKAAAEGWDGSVLLVQPTVQPIYKHHLTAVMASEESAALAINVRHQIWSSKQLYTERVNRQDIGIAQLQELGVRWWPDGVVGSLPAKFIGYEGLIDIDSAADYQSVTIPKQVALWPIADERHGMGHLRRCLAIAERLQHHDITFINNDMDEDATHIISERGWVTRQAFDVLDADLWIVDRLDNTDLSQLPGLVVSFEDTSPHLFDVRINALYGEGKYSGADWCVLRPEFLAGDYQIRDEPLYEPRLLVLFGGTDPSGLGEVVAGLFPNHPVDWIKAGDDRAVAEAMHNADILITSAGRTVFEAAAVGIPTIVLAQNLRETTHTHLGYAHGNIYLGLGRLVEDKVIVDTVRTLGEDVTLRRELSERGRPDGLGIQRIVHTVEGLLGGL